MNKQQKLEFITGSPILDVIEAMKDWGYRTASPPESNPNKRWWAAFGKGVISQDAYEYCDDESGIDNMIRQAAIKAIEQENDEHNPTA